jgi:phosphoribosyl-ATP pyrophosphohydrolase
LPACATGERPAHAPPGSSRQASREKLAEEATEVVIDAVRGERSAVIHESVDLLYNLVVLWSELGTAASKVWAEMDRRQALLGMAEKLPKEDGVGATSSAGH